MIRIRLDYERRGFHQDFYTIVSLDTNGRLATLDAKMERLRKQHIEATLYALDGRDQIDTEQGSHGVIGAVQKDEQWTRWRENVLA